MDMLCWNISGDNFRGKKKSSEMIDTFKPKCTVCDSDCEMSIWTWLFLLLLKQGLLYNMRGKIAITETDWSEVWAKRPQLFLSSPYSLHYQTIQDIWENKKIISLCFIMDKDQCRRRATGIIRGSKQTTPLFPCFVVSVRILCNNQ